MIELQSINHDENGDATGGGQCLGSFATLEEAHEAARLYWRDVDPGAWLQTQDDEQRSDGLDVPHSIRQRANT